MSTTITLSTEKWLRTGDGFFLCPEPLSEILLRMGLQDTGISRANPEDVTSYFDDWHLYCITGSETVYSLLKLREQEHDYVPGFSDGDVPAVTVSFIPFPPDALTALSEGDTADSSSMAHFVHCFRAVTDLPGQHHHPVLQRYFSRPEAQASYLIGDTYVRKLLALSDGGKIPFPDRLLSASRRIRRGLEALNQAAGKPICDWQAGYLTVADPQAPTQEETLCVLAAHTGNLSLNSFAAEIQFHAKALVQWENRIPFVGKSIWYRAAVRADMQVAREYRLVNLLFAPYYRPNSRLMKQQQKIHGIM